MLTQMNIEPGALRSQLMFFEEHFVNVSSLAYEAALGDYGSDFRLVSKVIEIIRLLYLVWGRIRAASDR
jgi:hypothetical protein